VVRFEEITTRNHAEDLRNTLLMFEVPEDVNSEEEGFYEHQLLELPVFLLEDVPDGEIPNDNPAVGEPLGTVIGLQTMPVQDLLLVKLSPAYGGQEIMVPFVDEIVPEVVPAEGDESGFVLLSPPEGLIELSTPLKGK
jgi:ribosome maturation factor rimM